MVCFYLAENVLERIGIGNHALDWVKEEAENWYEPKIKGRMFSEFSFLGG